jgi:DNA gyrase inhibitor GyrI
MAVNFHMENMPKQRIAFMRNLGPYGLGNKALMERLKSWAAANGLMHALAVILGIAWDDPTKTPAGGCRYDGCIAVKDDFLPADESVQSSVLEGGLYAVFTTAHTAQAVSEAWGEIFSELAKEAWVLDPTRPILERYVPEMVEKHLCEICMPVMSQQ